MKSSLKKLLIYGLVIGSLSGIGTSVYDKISFNKRVNKATSEILKKADSSRAILFGEAHIIDENLKKYKKFFKDNQYVEDLLDDLKEKGYSIFGVEVDKSYRQIIDDYLGGRLSKKDIEDLATSEAKKDNYEPAFIIYGPGLDLIDKAHFLGYEVVPIDGKKSPELSEILTREYEIFDNVDSILEKNPDKKLLVYIGSGHVNKHHGPFFPTLGFMLNKKYGDRVLSVDLTDYESSVPPKVDIRLPLVKVKLKNLTLDEILN